MSGDRRVMSSQGAHGRPTRSNYLTARRSVQYATVNRVEEQLALLMGGGTGVATPLDIAQSNKKQVYDIKVWERTSQPSTPMVLHELDSDVDLEAYAKALPSTSDSLLDAIASNVSDTPKPSSNHDNHTYTPAVHTHHSPVKVQPRAYASPGAAPSPHLYASAPQPYYQDPGYAPQSYSPGGYSPAQGFSPSTSPPSGGYYAPAPVQYAPQVPQFSPQVPVQQHVQQPVQITAISPVQVQLAPEPPKVQRLEGLVSSEGQPASGRNHSEGSAKSPSSRRSRSHSTSEKKSTRSPRDSPRDSPRKKPSVTVSEAKSKNLKGSNSSKSPTDSLKNSGAGSGSPSKKKSSSSSTHSSRPHSPHRKHREETEPKKEKQKKPEPEPEEDDQGSILAEQAHEVLITILTTLQNFRENLEKQIYLPPSYTSTKLVNEVKALGELTRVILGDADQELRDEILGAMRKLVDVIKEFIAFISSQSKPGKEEVTKRASSIATTTKAFLESFHKALDCH